MQNYSTIIGVIELRQQSVGYATTQKRYGIGSSTVTLIMKRFKELGLTLEELRVNTPPENRRSDRRSPTARPQKSYTPAVGQTPCV